MSNLAYNTQQPHLDLPEYGRNVLNMVQECKMLTNRDERNQMANQIVKVMGRITKVQEVTDPDTLHMLWNHLARLADYELDVDYPFPIENYKVKDIKPSILPDSQHYVQKRVYGLIVEQMINKACEMTDPEARLDLLEKCANQMKREFILANPIADNVDNKIMSDLVQFTQGRFVDEMYNEIYLLDASDLLVNEQYDESKMIEIKKKKKKKK